ncbi:MAG: DUF3419 family protein [Rhabdochlamydiaceae bacterium]
MERDIINYSQCWEDPAVLRAALAINAGDSVLSVTSGGDNTLALFLEGPKKIISIDVNPVQNFLLELKMQAAKSLDYREYVEFLGARPSYRRIALFEKIRIHLSPEASAWFSSHKSLIAKGILAGGRFERFLTEFRQYVLPLIHTQKVVKFFLMAPSIELQRQFYRNRWNTRRWRFFFRIISCRFILEHFARQRGMFTYTEKGAIAQKYFERLEKNFTEISFDNNYFMHFCLTGDHGKSLPPYLDEINFNLFKDRSQNLSIVTADLLSYLKSVPEQSFSKFNLSDIFEALPPETNDDLWYEIVRTAKDNAVVVYWSNLVERSYPSSLATSIRADKDLENQLRAKDRVFFYGSFHVNTIFK